MNDSTCSAVRKELKAYLDGSVSMLARFRVRKHLKLCEACRTELAAIDRMGRELRKMAAELDSDAGMLDPTLRARILAAIPPEQQALARPGRRLISPPSMLTLGTAGALAVVVGILWWPAYSRSNKSSRNTMAALPMHDAAAGRAAAPGDSISNLRQAPMKLQKSAPQVSFDQERASAVNSRLTAGVAAPQLSAKEGKQDIYFATTPREPGSPASAPKLSNEAVAESLTVNVRDINAGTQQVVHLALKNNGTVTSQAHAYDADYTDLTVSLEPSDAEVFTNAIRKQFPSQQNRFARGADSVSWPLSVNSSIQRVNNNSQNNGVSSASASASNAVSSANNEVKSKNAPAAAMNNLAASRRASVTLRVRVSKLR